MKTWFKLYWPVLGVVMVITAGAISAQIPTTRVDPPVCAWARVIGIRDPNILTLVFASDSVFPISAAPDTFPKPPAVLLCRHP